jgi:hypothetical protein
MTDQQETGTGDNRRREHRKSPYFYDPYVVINPESPPKKIVGYVRNESRNGFSAQFNRDFPYRNGDIVDVRVGYQRAWAEVVWIEKLLNDLCVVGFRMHPEEFLRQQESTHSD